LSFCFQVARESALNFNPDAKIKAYHASIFDPEYSVDFFRRFKMVMNALDNRAARNHVNRMCLAADIPLIESGTAGYLGQVTVIKKGETECYECQPKPTQKTFPGCTIRNTPSEPIHCIVWAKHLFNQLFGEEDPDQDVSPDTEDPEAAANAGDAALNSEAKDDTVGGIERRSTREWAKSTGYDPVKLFTKLFGDDVKYLLSMENLWKKRRAPSPLQWDNLPDVESTGGAIADQRVWDLKECAKVFGDSVEELKNELAAEGEGGMLVWDKDTKAAMDFVTAAANIRSHIFHIPRKSRFDIKSMAGNIIPAIATTNAIIAALIVMEGMKILAGKFDECRQIYLNRQPNPRKKLLVPCILDKPNPKCYVCAEKPEVTIQLNVGKITVKTFEDKILKGGLGMVAPDVEIDDGKGTIIISSEEGETEGNAGKLLSDFHITTGSRLKCDDFLQVYDLVVNIFHVEKLEEEKEFEIIGDMEKLQAEAEAKTKAAEANGNGKDEAAAEDEDDELMMFTDAPEDDSTPAPIKRKASDSTEDESVSKKAKLEEGQGDVVVL
jgi:ubiquitin-like 1-activating enzyme E1 B